MQDVCWGPRENVGMGILMVELQHLAGSGVVVGQHLPSCHYRLAGRGQDLRLPPFPKLELNFLSTRGRDTLH